MTLAEFLATIKPIALNTIDANVETPYSAIKLLVSNQQQVDSRSKAVLKALQFAHVSVVKPTLTELVNSEEQVDNQYVTVTRLESQAPQYVYVIKSTIDKTFADVRLRIAGIEHKCIASFNDTEHSVTVTLSSEQTDAEHRLTIS